MAFCLRFSLADTAGRSETTPLLADPAPCPSLLSSEPFTCASPTFFFSFSFFSPSSMSLSPLFALLACFSGLCLFGWRSPVSSSRSCLLAGFFSGFEVRGAAPGSSLSSCMLASSGLRFFSCGSAAGSSSFCLRLAFCTTCSCCSSATSTGNSFSVASFLSLLSRLGGSLPPGPSVPQGASLISARTLGGRPRFGGGSSPASIFRFFSSFSSFLSILCFIFSSCASFFS